MSISPRTYKKRKKATVELTSLLDLLFVMIFVNLIQQKNVTSTNTEVPKEKAPVVKVEPKPTPKPVEKTPQVFLVKAIFHFHDASQAGGGVSGKYEVQGSFDEKSNDLNLAGVKWIQLPQGVSSVYDVDMVPLAGKVDENLINYKGKVDYKGCSTFNLTRTEKNNKTPVSGTWTGSYTCLQGQTGLTLTIE